MAYVVDVDKRGHPPTPVLRGRGVGLQRIELLLARPQTRVVDIPLGTGGSTPESSLGLLRPGVGQRAFVQLAGCIR